MRKNGMWCIALISILQENKINNEKKTKLKELPTSITVHLQKKITQKPEILYLEDIKHIFFTFVPCG